MIAERRQQPRTTQAHRPPLRRLVVLLAVCAAALACAWAPRAALADSSDEVVRVGWYESSFNMTDDLGRRSGYAYEYQQKIAAFTGWNYEYVEGSWPDLLQMLMEGKIDLLSDVSYTEERAGKMLYASLPMGAEEYYVFVAHGEQNIAPEDPSSFDGKLVGAHRGSVQLALFEEWAQSNGAHPQIVELSGSEEENFVKLSRGTIDAYVTLEAMSSTEKANPVCKIGSSDFYFVVSQARPELLPELNAALYRIQDENQFYSQQLAAKYLSSTNVNLFLSADEKDWVDEHQTIRVGYQDNYLAFCAKDPQTGQLTGALKDYLAAASDCLGNAHLDFEPVSFPTAAAALEALTQGEVDCVFPANMTDYDGELGGFFMTSPVMRTDMSAVIRESDQRTFTKKEHITVAVNVGNPNYDMFLLDHFPTWRSIYFKDTPECLKAIADGKADCLLISNYRFNNISKDCDRLGLVTLSTGVEMDYCFAVRRSDTALYSILCKVGGEVPTSTVNAALTYYYTEDAKTGLGDTLRQNLLVAVAVFALVALAVTVLVLLRARLKKGTRHD